MLCEEFKIKNQTFKLEDTRWNFTWCIRWATNNFIRFAHNIYLRHPLRMIHGTQVNWNGSACCSRWLWWLQMPTADASKTCRLTFCPLFITLSFLRCLKSGWGSTVECWWKPKFLSIFLEYKLWSVLLQANILFLWQKLGNYAGVTKSYLVSLGNITGAITHHLHSKEMRWQA